MKTLPLTQTPRRWYWFFVFAVALLAGFSSTCFAQDEDQDLTPAALPSTKAGAQLKWVLEVVNGREMGDPKEKFTERFLEMVPPEDLRKSLTSLREKSFAGAKIVLHRLMADEERDDTISGIVRGEGTKRALAVFLITDDKTGKISGLRFAPAGRLGGDAGDWNSFQGDLGKLDGGVSFGAYELVPKNAQEPKGELALKPIYEFGEDKRLAIGSTFKLYVLGALAEQIAKGDLSWDDKLAIKDSLKSLPSGVMHLSPAGTELPISEYADKMISISDNTAAGHLLDKAGRARVEDYMARLNAGADRSRPFLSPREMFIIKLNKDKTLADRYAQANEDARRTMLAEGGDVNKGGLDLLHVGDWKDPIHIDDIEWFATAPECCRVMADLRRLEQLPHMEPLGHALRINPGIPFDKKTWPSVAFKGGSEPGVMNLTWLLEREDGRWFTLSVGWNNPKEALKEDRLIELAQKGVAILEKEGKGKEPTPPPAPKDKEAPRDLNDGN